MASQPKKYLVIQTAFIGDVILATAVLEKLHTHFPDAEIDFLVRKGNESLVKDHPFIHECLVWNKKENKYSGLWSLLKKIRKTRYEAVINLQRFAASGFLTAFSGAKETIGFDKNPFSFLFNKKIPHVIGSIQAKGKHEVERCLETIQHFTDSYVVMPKLYPSTSDFDAVSPYIIEKIITISPASVWFTKQARPETWVNLIQALQGRKIFLLGGPGDLQLCQEIKGPFANVEILAGKLSLLQSAALMSKAEMNYTNDSAPMHLCSAMNAPVTAVFCSTIPEFGFGPLAKDSHIVQTRESLACRPCGLHGFKACPQGHFRCAQINIEDLTNSLNSK